MYANNLTFVENTPNSRTYEQKDALHIPSITERLIAFSVQGNSMCPTIKPNETVICYSIDSLNDIKENELYIIVTKQFVWAKRIQTIRNMDNHVVQLKLISDNHLEYAPFLLEIEQVVKTFKVKLKLTDFK